MHLECGAENKLLSVSEPEVCKYSMRFSTPAACTAADVESARADLELLTPRSQRDEL